MELHMPILSQKVVFNAGNINLAPNRPGVYGLYQGSETIYYGMSDTWIRERLQSHLSGREGICTMSAQWMNWEEAAAPGNRERQLLDEHTRQHGRLPRCNNRAA